MFSNLEISKFRTELMGIATLLILMCHFIIFPNNKILSFVQSQGIIGVDIFLFLSGFGLSSSMQKKYTISTYYKKRFLRIFSVFLPVALLYIFLNGSIFSLRGLGIISTLGYWIGSEYIEWYTPAIILLYSIFPFVYKIIKLKKLSTCSLFLSILFYYGITYTMCNMSSQDYLFFVYRLPIFVIGIYTYVQLEGIDIKLATKLFVIGVVLSTFMFYRGLYSSSIWIITCSLCTQSIIVFSKLLLQRKTFINKIFKWFGNMSYEMFLVQILFLRLHLSKYISVTMMVIFIIIVAFLFNQLHHFLENKLKQISVSNIKI